MTKKPTRPPAWKPLTRRAAPMLAAGLLVAAGGCGEHYVGQIVPTCTDRGDCEPGTGNDAGVSDDAGN